MTTMVDSSGNSQDGAYSPHLGYPKFVAGLVAGNGAAQFANPAVAAHTGGATVPEAVIDWTGPFTVEFYAQLGSPAFIGNMVHVFPDITGSPQLQVAMGSSGDFLVRRHSAAADDVWDYDLSAVVLDGLPHRYCLTYDGTDAALYVDTNLIVPAFAAVATPTLVAATLVLIVGNDGFDQGVNSTVDEFAIYGYALTSGQDAAHAGAAGTSFAAYAAAVIADSPGGYYHLDDLPAAVAGWVVGRIGT